MNTTTTFVAAIFSFLGACFGAGMGAFFGVRSWFKRNRVVVDEDEP